MLGRIKPGFFYRPVEDNDYAVRVDFYVQNKAAAFSNLIDKSIEEFAFKNNIEASPIRINAEDFHQEVTKKERKIPNQPVAQDEYKGIKHYKATLYFIAEHDISETELQNIKNFIPGLYRGGLERTPDVDPFQVTKMSGADLKKELGALAVKDAAAKSK